MPLRENAMTVEFDLPESQYSFAKGFKSQHSLGKFFVLPNAYDIPSARMFENAGFPAVATSSAGLLVSMGFPDGESIPKDQFMSAVRKISNVLSVPLSVDLLTGFGRNTSGVIDSVNQVIAAGAVGINLEDFDHHTKSLIGIDEQSNRIRAIRELSHNLGLQFVINARTDAMSHGSGVLSTDLEIAIERSERFIEAGADCVYPMGLVDYSSISEFVKSVSFPTNVMIRKGLPHIKDLKKIGVNRLSFGPSASYVTLGLLQSISRDIIENERYGDLLEGAIDFSMLNSLAVKRKSI